MPQTTDRDVGIITFHRTHNFGAFLQVFAMTNILSNANYIPCVIDYQDRTQWLSESWPVIRKFRRPIRLLDFIRKTLAFRRVLKQLTLTPYTRNPNNLNKLSFPRVIVGSDIVWNYHICGRKSPFWGYFGATRRIAYAPSFGWASPTDPPPSWLGAFLQNFDKISVRDINSQTIVKMTTGNNVPIVLDPTFLWDFSGSEICPHSTAMQRPYLLVYAFDMTSVLATEIRNFADEHNLSVIGVGYRLQNNLCDNVLMGLTPFEWLWTIKHARFIYTNTFHGSIFCIKYAKSFALTMEHSVRPKLEPLLQRTGLMHRVIKHDGDLQNTLMTNEDFEKVHEQLKSESEQSLGWLMESIK